MQAHHNQCLVLLLRIVNPIPNLRHGEGHCGCSNVILQRCNAATLPLLFEGLGVAVVAVVQVRKTIAVRSATTIFLETSGQCRRLRLGGSEISFLSHFTIELKHCTDVKNISKIGRGRIKVVIRC